MKFSAQAGIRFKSGDFQKAIDLGLADEII